MIIDDWHLGGARAAVHAFRRRFSIKGPIRSSPSDLVLTCGVDLTAVASCATGRALLAQSKAYTVTVLPHVAYWRPAGTQPGPASRLLAEAVSWRRAVAARRAGAVRALRRQVSYSASPCSAVRVIDSQIFVGMGSASALTRAAASAADRSPGTLAPASLTALQTAAAFASKSSTSASGLTHRKRWPQFLASFLTS